MSAADCARTVADVAEGGRDAMGHPIAVVYSRKAPDYAVYRAQSRVMIHFADDRDAAVKQRSDLSGLTYLRDEVEGLVGGWRDAEGRGFFGLSNPERLHGKAGCYDRRVGGALIQALEGDPPAAGALLEKLKSEILNERIAWARFEYLITAFACVLGLMFVAWLMASLMPVVSPSPGNRTGAAALVIIALALAGAIGLATAHLQSPPLKAGLLFAVVAIPAWAMLLGPSARSATIDGRYADGLAIWRAAAAGGIGAFFSISLAIRGRTILPDLLRMSNMMDAVLRITIGFIAGAVLMGLIRGGMVEFSFGGARTEAQGLLFILIVGFVAGFAERFVPDLLEKASAKPAEPTVATSAAKPAAQPQADAQPARQDDKPAAPAAPANDFDPDDRDVEVGIEGFDLDDDEITQDAELPAAAGGVDKAA